MNTSPDHNIRKLQGQHGTRQLKILTWRRQTITKESKRIPYDTR